MSKIKYRLITGELPINVQLLDNNLGGAVIDNNIHTVYEEGEFTGMGDGDYTLKFIDDMECVETYDLTLCEDCPEGYTPTVNGCYKMETVAPTPPTASFELYSKSNKAYSYYGTLVFDTFNINGTGTFTRIPTTNEWWINDIPNDTIKGPLNRSGVWTDFVTSNQDIGFSVCADIPISKYYYVGVGCDNWAKIYLNGMLILEQNRSALMSMVGAAGLPGGSDTQTPHTYWYVYPIYMKAGLNIIEVYGHNEASVAAVGIEIYNRTYDELAAAESYEDLGDGLIFSTKDMVGETATLGSFGVGYECPDGYALVTCDGPYYCGKISQLECGEEAPLTTIAPPTTIDEKVPIEILKINTTKNAPNKSSFTFSIYGSVDSKYWIWDMGDGNILENLTTIGEYYYHVSGTKTITVSTLSTDWSQASIINFSNNDIVGELDLSVFTKFTSGAGISVGYNTGMTSVVLPTLVSGAIFSINAPSSGISTINLSTLAYANDCNFVLNDCSSLSSITMPTTSSTVKVFDAFNCDLGYINFIGMTNILKANGARVRLNNNGMTSGEVNHILVDLAYLLSTEGIGGDYTERIINIGGSNACPDYSSGGYDGIAAVTTLEGKGIEVILSDECSTTTIAE